MPLIGSISIAMMASTKSFQKGLDGARNQLARFGKGVMSIQGLLTGSFAGAGIVALAHFAEMAAKLQQNIQRLEVVFGDASGSIVAQAKKMNEAFGTSELASTAAATKMGGLFESLGVAKEPAAEMTDQLLVMAQAIASFKHIGFDEAVTKVFAGMAGKGKGLKEFGITVSATMSAQERFNAIMQGGAGIVGNMGQRAGDASNAWKEFHGRVEALEITLGENLPEVVGPFFKELNVSLVAAIDWFKGLNNETLNWGEQMLSSGKGAAEGMGWVQMAIGSVADAWQQMNLGFHDFRSGFSEAIAYILGGLAKVLDGLDWIFDKLGMTDKVKPDLGTGDLVRIWGDTLHETAKKEYEEFQKAMGAPLASEGINAAYQAAHEKIQAARHEVTKAALDAGAPAAKAAAGSTLAKSAGAALSIGSKEAAEAMIRSKYQLHDDKDHKKKMAKNSDKTVELLAGIKANLEAGDGEMETWDLD